MNSLVLLKEKSVKRIVYFYSADVSLFGSHEKAVVDGEIEYSPQNNTFTTLKRATGDGDGYHAEWLFSHLRRTILKEGCPEKKFIAVG